VLCLFNVYVPIKVPIYVPVKVPIYVPVKVPIYIPIKVSVYVLIKVPVYVPIYISVYVIIRVCVYIYYFVCSLNIRVVIPKLGLLIFYFYFVGFAGLVRVKQSICSTCCLTSFTCC